MVNKILRIKIIHKFKVQIYKYEQFRYEQYR